VQEDDDSHVLPWGLYCIDSDWKPPGGHELTYQPVLDLLRSLSLFDCTRRTVGTLEELRHRIRQWVGLPQKWWGLVISSHGWAGEICVGDEERMSLAEVGETIAKAGGCGGRIIHLGGCRAMDVSEEEVRQFLRLTGAKALSGYRNVVEWPPSVALELLYFTRLAKTQTWQFERLWREFETQIPGLVSMQGFTIWTESRTYSAE
jgi:hypothetical protein